MQQYSGLLQFRIDPQLSFDLRKGLDLILSAFKNAVKSDSLSTEKIKNKHVIDFMTEGSFPILSPGSELRICLIDKNQSLFSFGQNINESEFDAVLDESLNIKQLESLIFPSLQQFIWRRQEELVTLGLKNIRKLELNAKSITNRKVKNTFTSDSLLEYFQTLVDFEKELIQVDELYKLEKVLKQFVKSNIENANFHFLKGNSLLEIIPSHDFLVLPPFRGECIGIEINWQEQDTFKFIKRLFFFYTLINFLKSQHDIEDPFFKEELWEDILDAIPFPMALFSTSGEVYQHNSIFAKLGFAPGNCLKLKLREKILINDIPYNIFRKEIYHADNEKILFIFFTESFFLKGDGNLAPTGQELGIISSSIAHELNNPLAGIQAALTLLLLDESLGQDAEQTLKEMKNGAQRCKQLIETFLGFSRANPRNIPTQAPFDLCYQQAQNLLRFRSVESGIRFNLKAIKHNDFSAQVNASLLTMTFYLISGELMTLYSHQLLVANKNQVEKIIKGEIIESAQEIQILLYELNISKLSLSKLIQNLLNIENFVLQVSDYSLRFIHRQK